VSLQMAVSSPALHLQRCITHLDNLEQLSRATLCRDLRTAIFVTVPGPELREYLTNCPNVNPELGRQKGPYAPDAPDHLAASLATTAPLDLRGLATVGTLQFEVQAGQRRITAPSTCGQRSGICRWQFGTQPFSGSLVAGVHLDSDKLKYSDLEKLRTNGANNAFEDTDGIVWFRVLNIEEQEEPISARLRRPIESAQEITAERNRLLIQVTPMYVRTIQGSCTYRFNFR